MEYRKQGLSFTEENKIVILESILLISSSPIRYLDYRMIPFSISKVYCIEVRYSVRDSFYFAIGFQNNAGGYERRSSRFKASSSPKTFRHIRNGQSSLCVFEAFFDFLSFIILFPDKVVGHHFENARPVMEQYASVLLFLDNDPSGRNTSAYTISVSSCYHNQDHIYRGYVDLNDFLCSKTSPADGSPFRSVRPP